MNIRALWDMATCSGSTFQRYVLPPYSALMIQAVRTSETSAHFEATRHHIPGGSYIQEQRVFGNASYRALQNVLSSRQLFKKSLK
jgi:hypothetical protein